MKSLSENFIINSYDSTPDRTASPGALLRIMQECACRHAAVLKRGHDDLLPQGLMWVLSRLRVKFNIMPQWGDEITVRTWPSGAERIFFYREFVISDKSGKELLTADSAWSAIDFNKGRVCRAKVFPELDFSGYEQVFTDRPDKIAPSENLEPGVERQAGFMDLDMNNHVNNVRCVEWLLEFFTEDFRSQKCLECLDVNFLGQIDYNDKVTVLGKELIQNTFDLALQANNNNRPATTARTTWTNKPAGESKS